MFCSYFSIGDDSYPKLTTFFSDRMTFHQEELDEEEAELEVDLYFPNPDLSSEKSPYFLGFEWNRTWRWFGMNPNGKWLWIPIQFCWGDRFCWVSGDWLAKMASPNGSMSRKRSDGARYISGISIFGIFRSPWMTSQRNMSIWMFSEDRPNITVITWSWAWNKSTPSSQIQFDEPVYPQWFRDFALDASAAWLNRTTSRNSSAALGQLRPWTPFPAPRPNTGSLTDLFLLEQKFLEVDENWAGPNQIQIAHNLAKA